MVLLTYLLLPLLITTTYHFTKDGRKSFTLKEYLFVLGLSILAAVSTSYIVNLKDESDFYVKNSYVASKHSEKVSCRHSYSCNCYMTGGKNPMLVCSTCYEHSYDIDWLVVTPDSEIKINKIDSQGLKEPPRYTEATIGEYAAVSLPFTNYIKGSPDSLFTTIKKTKTLNDYYKANGGEIEYPRIFDYYRIEHGLNLSKNKLVTPKLSAEYQKALEYLLESFAKKKIDINIMVFFVDSKAQRDELAVTYLGGKLNDVFIIYILGQDRAEEVSVLTWAEGTFKTTLQFEFNKDLKLDVNKFTTIIETNIGEYRRADFSKFKYLHESHQFKLLPYLLGLIVVLVVNIVAIVVAFRKDLFDEEPFQYYNMYNRN